MDNYYVEFDSLMEEGNEVLKYMMDHQKEIVSHADTAKYHEVYTSLADDLGILSPSLIAEIVTGGYRKGRKLKQKPKGKGYCLYEFDSVNKPLRLFRFTDEDHLDVIYYFIDYNNTLFAVPCYVSDKDKNLLEIYPTYMYRMEYRDGRIYRFSSIDSCSLWHEVYEYVSNDYVECKNHYYVPELHGSSKSVPPGWPGSPMQTWLAKMNMDGKKVSELLFYKLYEDREELIYEYERKRR